MTDDKCSGLDWFEESFGSDLRKFDDAVSTLISSARAAGYFEGMDKGWDKGWKAAVEYETGLRSPVSTEE